MQAITTIGLDIAKSVFQVHGVDAQDKVVVRRQLSRSPLLSASRARAAAAVPACRAPSRRRRARGLRAGSADDRQRRIPFSRCCRHRATGSLSFAAASIGDGLGAGLTPSLYLRARAGSAATTEVDAPVRLMIDIAEFLFRDAAATELRGRSALPPVPGARA